MQSYYPERFERDMSCTESQWLGWLPAAIGHHAWQRQASCVCVNFAKPQGGVGTLSLSWRPLPPRVHGLVRLPRLGVTFEFNGMPESERQAFMRRFDLYMQRGGG